MQHIPENGTAHLKKTTKRKERLFIENQHGKTDAQQVF